MPHKGQFAIVTRLEVSSVLIVKLRDWKTRVEQIAPSQSGKFLTIAETNKELFFGEKPDSHTKRCFKPPNKFRKRALLHNNYNAKLRNKRAKIRREIGRGNLKMQ